MKKLNFHWGIIAVYVAMLFGGAALIAAEALDYGQKENWLISAAEQTDSEFDVFYVYPTVFSDKTRVLMDPADPKIRKKALDFSKDQTGIFRGNVRIFVPFVRQLEYRRGLQALKDGTPWYETEMKAGIDDTVAALRHYLANWNQGRPFILLGHSQGAMELYEALRRIPEIDVTRGLVAAYLPGIPKVTYDKIESDFRGRRLRWSSSPDSLGDIIVWNTQSSAVKVSFFTGNGVYGVNPLNWRAFDQSQMLSDSNVRSISYRVKAQNPVERISESVHFCGARLDAVSGAVIVDLPEHGEYDAKGALGDGIFHPIDVWLFAGNIDENARHRVTLWKSGKFTEKR